VTSQPWRSPSPERPIPVLVQAGNGPVVVWHSVDEYAAHFKGVDLEAAMLLGQEEEGERLQSRRNSAQSDA
jgi:hypothetical protein